MRLSRLLPISPTIFKAFATVFLVMGCACMANAQQPKPGIYVTEGGWGTLDIAANGDFTIQAVGANAHYCEVAGRIEDSKTITAEGCPIGFAGGDGRISVVPDDNAERACREHCGFRAWFKGTYFAQVPSCRDENVKAVREKFLGLYEAKRHREAAGLLNGLLSDCGRFLYWPVDAQVRNDLAVAYHRLKDDGACRRVLSPLKRAFIDDPQKTGIAFAPADWDWAEGITEASRFNWKLCKGAKHR